MADAIPTADAAATSPHAEAMGSDHPPPSAAASAGGAARLMALSLWAALVLLGLGFRLGGYPLMDPDEGRNAEVAREMEASGDWVLPTLDGLPYLDKPVLFFATGAAAIAAIGPSELAVRAPALAFTVATLVLIAWFARRTYGPAAAWIAGLTAASAPLTVAFARTVIFDSALTFFVVLALLAFFVAVEGTAAGRESGGGRWRRAALPWTVLAWAAMGLGVLTKGPVAVVLPLLVAAPYAVWRRSSRAVWHPLGIAALLVVAVPWVWAVARRVPDFLGYALLTETWGRLTTQELKRGGPVWYFVPVLLWGGFPWVVVAAAGAARRFRSWWRERATSPSFVFLLLWVLVPLTFFSLSQSKRPQYVLPLVPALALLVARLWTSGREVRLPGARAGAGSLAIVGCLLLGVGGALASSPDLGSGLPVSVPLAARTAIILGGISLLGGILAWAWSARRELCLVALGLPVVALPPVTMPLLREVAVGRSTSAVAGPVADVLGSGGRLVAIDAFAPSLLFYLQRPALVASDDGAPLRSNYIIHAYDRLLAVPGSPLRPAGFWRHALAACEEPTVFLLDRRSEAARATLEETGAPLIGATRHWAAYGPCHPAGASRPGPE